MPTYEYICQECEQIFTLVRPMSQRRETAVCPKCSGTGYFKVSSPIFSLNGADPGFPGAYSKWAKDREKRLAKEQQAE